MSKLKDNQIYVVEFGKPDSLGLMSFGGSIQPVFVIAEDYQEAADKALSYIASTKSNSVICEHGSLNLIDEEVNVKAVKLLTNNIIF